MKEKLYIQEFICNLVLLNTLSYKISMHNLYTNFVKILDICKLFSQDLVNEQGRRVNQQVQNYKTCLKNSRFGVEKFNFSLGLSFNFFCIDIILLSV